MKLSAIVTAKNEEKVIARCVQSLAFADEIIVVDGQSTDRTAEIARQSGATVYVRPWQGYGKQKNAGMRVASGEWCLFIDADEEVPAQLATEMQQLMASPTATYGWLKIVTVFLGRPLVHLSGHNPRLLKKGAGTWTEAAVHEQVRLSNGHILALSPPILPTPLLHHSHPTINAYLKKMHRYTSLDAKEMAAAGRHRSGRQVQAEWWLPVYVGGRQLFKLLFYRRGILDGWAGIVWCLLSGYYEWEMAKKYLKIKMTKSKGQIND